MELDINQSAAKAHASILTKICHGAAREAGWWNDIRTGEDLRGKKNFAELLMLCVSELAEAMEGDRKGLMDEHVTTRPSRDVELADAVIRIFDLAGGFDIDLAGALADKLSYNARRADHKLANRLLEGGKKY